MRTVELQQGIMRMFEQWTTIGILCYRPLVPARAEGAHGRLGDKSCPHVYLDTSFQGAIARGAPLRDRRLDRFLIGADTESSGTAAAYFPGFAMWAPVIAQPKPDTKLKAITTKDEHIFDERRTRVRERRTCGNYTITRREHAR